MFLLFYTLVGLHVHTMVDSWLGAAVLLEKSDSLSSGTAARAMEWLFSVTKSSIGRKCAFIDTDT